MSIYSKLKNEDTRFVIAFISIPVVMSLFIFSIYILDSLLMTPEESEKRQQQKILEKENIEKYYNFKSSFKANEDGILYRKTCIEGKEYIAFKSPKFENLEVLTYSGPIGDCK